VKLVRFQKDTRVFQGILQDGQVFLVDGCCDKGFKVLQEAWPQNEVKLLAPCVPSKVICVGLNYADHAQEMDLVIPKWPVIFMKPSTTVVGPEAEIIYPGQFVRRLDYEGELAVVIKKVGKNIPEQEALDYVLGYTCANDVTARNLQAKDGQWTVAKSFDTFMPLGPVIETELSWNELDISCRLNGEIKQQSNTKNLIFGVPFLIHYLSHIMTLLPGDVIITGTPSGVGAMEIGDEVSVTIEGIGTLTNLVGKA
jgi:2-keto-4-pentenoate hydratase/2-oxohepta-3-ene-1,7-dioic acid hydratase in catechol pathway